MRPAWMNRCLIAGPPLPVCAGSRASSPLPVHTPNRTTRCGCVYRGRMHLRDARRAVNARAFGFISGLDVVLRLWRPCVQCLRIRRCPPVTLDGRDSPPFVRTTVCSDSGRPYSRPSYGVSRSKLAISCSAARGKSVAACIGSDDVCNGLDDCSLTVNLGIVKP